MAINVPVFWRWCGELWHHAITPRSVVAVTLNAKVWDKALQNFPDLYHCTSFHLHSREKSFNFSSLSPLLWDEFLCVAWGGCCYLFQTKSSSKLMIKAVPIGNATSFFYIKKKSTKFDLKNGSYYFYPAARPVWIFPIILTPLIHRPCWCASYSLVSDQHSNCDYVCGGQHDVYSYWKQYKKIFEVYFQYYF